MKIGIPVYEGVDMLDVAGPFEMFHWAGFEIELVTETPGPVTFNSGLKAVVEKGFADAAVYDALWTPGGDPDALARLIDDPKRTYLDFLVARSATARYTCSVCEGAMLLAAAGLLDGYEATTHWAFVPCFTERFPLVKPVAGNPRYCLDRDRLTGGGISSGLDEALKLIELLWGTDKAKFVQQQTQYYPSPPVASQIPAADTCPLPPAKTKR